MGDIADYYLEQALLDFDFDFGDDDSGFYSLSFVHHNRLKHNFYNNIWMTREGHEVELENMTNSHIGHCIYYLRQNHPKSPWIKKFEKEWRRRKPNAKINKFLNKVGGKDI